MSIFKKNKTAKTEKNKIVTEDIGKKIENAHVSRSRAAKSSILNPHVSEKAVKGEAEGRYVFLVDKSAKKPEIKKEIQERYGVKVISVNTVVKKCRETHWRGRTGKRPIVKKAIVTIKKGDKIEY